MKKTTEMVVIESIANLNLSDEELAMMETPIIESLIEKLQAIKETPTREQLMIIQQAVDGLAIIEGHKLPKGIDYHPGNDVYRARKTINKIMYNIGSSKDRNIAIQMYKDFCRERGVPE